MDDWFYYDWQMDGDPAQFGVDMTLHQKAPHPGRPLLLHLRCEMEQGGALTPRGRRHIDRLEKKCLKELPKLEYAGYIEDDARRVMFFYGDKPRRLEELEALTEKERVLRCTAGCAHEPGWETYFTMLYPDAAKLHTETNRKNIELYRQNGDNTAAVRRITLHTFFPMENLAAQFAEEARLTGFAIGEPEFNPEIDEPYGVRLHRITTLEKPALDRHTSEAEYLAEKYLGRLMYWDSPVIPRSSPLKAPF